MIDPKKQLEKALNWLQKKAGDNWTQVAVTRGYAQFVGYVYRIKRETKPDIRFVINLNDGKLVNIKRICI